MKLIFDEESGQYLYLVDNVYPKIDTLNVEPCRKVIQDAFEDHITHAPGMEHVREMVNGPIIPTPGAVMECTKLLYDCIGDVMTIDVGGATTDVHAVTEDSDAVARILTAPEPKAKRTVEGDLGVYVNRMKVIESIGEEKDVYKRQVLYRDINCVRSFVDACESKKVMAWANILQIDGAHNANATAREAWKVMPELIVQHLSLIHISLLHTRTMARFACII